MQESTLKNKKLLWKKTINFKAKSNYELNDTNEI